jgi:hypothetical protein
VIVPELELAISVPFAPLDPHSRWGDPQFVRLTMRSPSVIVWLAACADEA